ncbi:MAG: hypothetical protein R3247_17905 [Rhodothermales bacterium]|nr:hypothetical protein [Rhodothermales bacterium]
MKRLRHTAPRLVKATAAEPHPQYLEPSLFYDPPYERPLEDEFAWHLVKYLEPITGLRYQVRVETPCAPLWVDFVVEHGARRIGFELGEPETVAEAEQDRLRDALLLGAGGLDVLYRFRAPDLLYRPHDALHLAARWDRALFSERGRINLQTLASPEARTCHPRPQDTVARIVYDAPALEGTIDDEAFAYPEDVPAELVVRRLSRAQPGAWMPAYDAALKQYGIPEDALTTRWAKTG